MHFFGYGVATWGRWQAVKSVLVRFAPKPGASFNVLILCSLASIGVGARNEVIEFAAKWLVPDTNVGGYLNTAWDLVFNVAGATTAAVLIWIAERD